MTIQPELSPLDFFSSTLATVAFPKSTRTSVPMNSPINRLSMFMQTSVYADLSLLRGASAAHARGSAACKGAGLNFAKLRDAPDFHPLRHENVSGVVEDGSVRVHKLTGDELAAVLGGAGRVALPFTHVR